MEPRAKEWMLVSARGDYHAIARLLREEPRLARRRVSFSIHFIQLNPIARCSRCQTGGGVPQSLFHSIVIQIPFLFNSIHISLF